MEKEILDALTAKFVGVDAKILGRVAKKLALTANTAEQVATAVEGVTFQQILESYGDARATDAQKTAVINYEKKYNLKEGKQVDGTPVEEPEKKPAGDDTPAWAKALVDRIAALEGDNISKSRSGQLNAHLGKLPDYLKKAYSHINLKELSDDDFNGVLSDAENAVKEYERESAARSTKFGRPYAAVQNAQPQAGEPTDEQLNAVVSHLKF